MRSLLWSLTGISVCQTQKQGCWGMVCVWRQIFLFSKGEPWNPTHTGSPLSFLGTNRKRNKSVNVNSLWGLDAQRQRLSSVWVSFSGAACKTDTVCAEQTLRVKGGDVLISLSLVLVCCPVFKPNDIYFYIGKLRLKIHFKFHYCIFSSLPLSL